MENKLFLNIITPSGIIFKDFIISTTFVDPNGEMMILKDYSPTIGKINRSIIKIKLINNEEVQYIIDSGLFVVNSNILKIMTSFCIENSVEEAKRITKMREQTLKILNGKNHNNVEFTAEIALFKNLLKIKKK